MAEWKRVKLGEVADLALGKMLDAKKNRGEPYRYLNNVAVRWGSFDLAELPEMRFEQDEIERYLIRENDIVICEGGEPGRCAIWNNSEPIFFQKALHRARVKEFACPRYVYYSFTNLVISGATKQYETGSTIRHLPAQNLKEIEIPLPPLPTQRKIAAVLGALDDKIENNRKICANLEAQAQALFKSWFVDFEPFGGRMPSGWKMGKLTDIALYLNGLAMQKFRPTEGGASYPVLKIKELRQGFCDGESERCTAELESKYIVHDGDVIFSWSGSLLVDLWCGGDAGLNQHLFKVIPKGFPKWFVYYWTSQHLSDFINIAAGKATTMGHITREHLEGAVVTIPNDEALVEVGKSLGAFVDLIVEKRLESRALAATRDALLPKLMSGEIDVEKVEV